MRLLIIIVLAFSLTGCASKKFRSKPMQSSNHAVEQPRQQEPPTEAKSYIKSEQSKQELQKCDDLKGKKKRSECLSKYLERTMARVNLTFPNANHSEVRDTYTAYSEEAVPKYAAYIYGENYKNAINKDALETHAAAVYYEVMADSSEKLEVQRQKMEKAGLEARLARERLWQAEQSAEIDNRMRWMSIGNTLQNVHQQQQINGMQQQMTPANHGGINPGNF